MRQMGRAGMAAGPNTSRSPPEPKVYPHLLRGVPESRPNQICSTDMTDLRLAHGFAYLGAIMDGYSRRVLAWRISNRMDAPFCVDCLEEALRVHGRPEVFNSDQGSQFTSEAFTRVLKREEVLISREGRGRAFDHIFVERLWRNVKHEDISLKGYVTRGELMVGLTAYFVFYNGERAHHSLGHQTPDVVHRTAIGGGAVMVHKFGGAAGEPPVPRRSTGGSPPAEARAQSKAKKKVKTGAAPSSC